MITIERMTEDQIDETRKIVEEAFQIKASDAKLEKKGRSFSLVAVEDGKVKGHVLIHEHIDPLLNEKKLYLEKVAVKKEARGKGIGRKLLEAVFKYAEENGVSAIDLTSNSSRLAAHHLYKSCGFVIRNTCVFRKKIKK